MQLLPVGNLHLRKNLQPMLGKDIQSSQLLSWSTNYNIHMADGKAQSRCTFGLSAQVKVVFPNRDGNDDDR